MKELVDIVHCNIYIGLRHRSDTKWVKIYLNEWTLAEDMHLSAKFANIF